MMSNSRHVLLMTALASYSVLVFVLDVVTPRGIEVWVLNLPVVIAPVLFRNPRLVVVFFSAWRVRRWSSSGGSGPPPGFTLAVGTAAHNSWASPESVTRIQPSTRWPINARHLPSV